MSVVLLTIGYVLIAALLLSLNLATPYSRWVKVSAIVVVSCLYVGSWYAYQGMTGWASANPLPENFRLLWIEIQEPDKGTSDKGYIYYWLRVLDEAGLPAGPPRAHKVSWDRLAAEAAEDALLAMSEGEQLNGRQSRNLLSKMDKATDSDEAELGAEQSVSGVGGGRVAIEFVRAPPRELPAKTPL
jgi:hypothetical protein